MRVSFHPPLLLAAAGANPPPATLRRCGHAALWLSVVIEPWQAERSGHLHLVNEAPGSGWREVDLGRHPLRPAVPADEPPSEAEAVLADLQPSLAGRCLELYRVPALGLVSEIGEGREDFRRRATGGLRPQLQRRLAEDPGAVAKERLASELAALAASIETLQLGELWRWVRRAEVGVLLVAPGVRLEAPRYRPLMV